MISRGATAFFLAVLIGGLGWLARPVVAADCFFYSSGVGYVCRAQQVAQVFKEPELAADSLLTERTYAYMDDDIFIYPEPSTAVPPLYSVGKGFLYVTIYGQVEQDGQLWYRINPGQYAQAQGIHLVRASPFNGVELTRPPARPFGWVVQEKRPSREPGVEPDLATPKWRRYTFLEVFDAAVDDEGWIWYDVGGGNWLRQTQVGLVDANPRPAGVGPGEFWVEVDLYEQSFAAYEGDRMVYAGLVSSGLNRWPTHEGLFQVWSRHLEVKMSGAEGKVDYYFIEDVPHTLFFDEDIALHGAYWHDWFGFKHSHGCVNMPPRDAEWVYNWSAVAPNDLWVWVHTSDPADYLEKDGG